MKAIHDRLMETNRASMKNHGIMLPSIAQKRINEMRIRTEKRPRMTAEAETLANAMRNMDQKASKKKANDS